MNVDFSPNIKEQIIFITYIETYTRSCLQSRLPYSKNKYCYLLKMVPICSTDPKENQSMVDLALVDHCYGFVVVASWPVISFVLGINDSTAISAR